nr:acyloxyacyl hydrolase [Ottowia beijingensis]
MPRVPDRASVLGRHHRLLCRSLDRRAPAVAHPHFAHPHAQHRLPVQRPAGAGRAVGRDARSTLGVRYQHISNAGIKKPNPGMDFVLLYYTHRF